MNRPHVFTGICAILIVTVASATAMMIAKHHAETVQASYPLPAGWVAATPEFLADADNYAQLTTDAARRLKAFTTSGEFLTIQSEQDRAKGIDARATVPCSATSGPVCTPAGFRYDNQRRAFAPIATGAPAAK